MLNKKIILMNKICTSIGQSNLLIEFGIDVKTADMRIGSYVGKSGKVDGTNVHYYTKDESFGAPKIIPGWSLSALLDLMNDKSGIAKEYGTWFSYDNEERHCSKHYDNPLDAAFEMVVWLKQNKKI